VGRELEDLMDSLKAACREAPMDSVAKVTAARNAPTLEMELEAKHRSC
jgi:hypothetical protein